ncbi:MAG: hypothetical protein [Caudoviricetes sp.]|nr:MAG: hypothetical protein [Caudoviricetes sp.]
MTVLLPPFHFRWRTVYPSRQRATTSRSVGMVMSRGVQFIGCLHIHLCTAAVAIRRISTFVIWLWLAHRRRRATSFAGREATHIYKTTMHHWRNIGRRDTANFHHYFDPIDILSHLFPPCAGAKTHSGYSALIQTKRHHSCHTAFSSPGFHIRFDKPL